MKFPCSDDDLFDQNDYVFKDNEMSDLYFGIICMNGQTDLCRTVSTCTIKVYSGLSLPKKHSEFTTLKEPLKLASSRSPARAGRSGTKASGRNSSKEGNKISW